MRNDYSDMSPVEIRVAILRAGTTQAAIARAISKRDNKPCSRELIARVIDGKVVSHRVRLGIAEAISIPAERIWRSYYLNYVPGRRGRRVSQNNRAITAAC
ncbi:MAG: hypothetical protein STSR0003_03960 [Smithella sp.]